MLYYIIIVILKFVAEVTLFLFLFFFFLLLFVSLIHESCGAFFVLENIFERLIQLNCPLLRESVKVKPPVHINILREISREVTRLVKF